MSDDNEQVKQSGGKSNSSVAGNRSSPDPGEAEREEPDGADKPEPSKGISAALRKLADSFHAKPTATSRIDKTKDRTGTFVTLGVGAVLLGLAFLLIFSSPEKPLRRDAHKLNLGRPEQSQNGEKKSVVPLTSAEPHGNSDTDTLSEKDISELGHPHKALSAAPPAPPKNDPYALNRIHFDNPPPPPAAAALLAAHPAVTKSSLIFVRSSANTAARGEPAIARQEPALEEILPPGTRLVARLETPVSSAVKAPVVAAIEYNYVKDGDVVIPAGSKAFGEMVSANQNGFVGIRFYRIQFADGTSAPIEANAMDLNFQPVKGVVTGRNRAKRFLTRTVTGLGSMAAQFAGTGLGDTVTEGTLLREQAAQNVALAGERELYEQAASTNVVITVPGQTRLYIVLSGEEDRRHRGTSGAIAGTPRKATETPSALELRELMQLKEELRKYSPSAQPTATNTPQPLPQ
jgi:type IV secretory pathway VirB10-like protein